MNASASPGRRIGVGVVAGVLIAAVIFAGGLFWVFTRSHDWSAKATAVVLPAPGIPSGTAASYYDTLSRGQIVETYAEILRLKKFQNASASGLNLTASQAGKATVTVAVVPNTALLTITATATNGAVAEALADGVFIQASEYVRSLASPYVVNSVSTAKGSATETTSHTGGFLAVLVVVALVVGLGVQQAVSQLANARSKSVLPPVPAPQVAAASMPDPFAPPSAPAYPQPPAPVAVRPTVGDGRQRPRWPAEPTANGASEPVGNGTIQPTGKSAAEPAGKGTSGSGRVEERTPEP